MNEAYFNIGGMTIFLNRLVFSLTSLQLQWIRNAQYSEYFIQLVFFNIQNKINFYFNARAWFEKDYKLHKYSMLSGIILQRQKICILAPITILKKLFLEMEPH